MALLITGASGYVGTWFINSLTANEKQNTLCPTHNTFDLNDYETMKVYFQSHSIDSVLHLAACLDSKNDSLLFQSNIVGVYNLLRLCQENNVSYVCFTSGNTVYGENSTHKHLETDSLAPSLKNRYAISKLYGELMVRQILDASPIKYSIVRIGDIYGPMQKTGALLKAVVKNIQSGQPQKLYGIGDRTRDYIYIDDVVAGLKHIIKNNLQGTYNLATGVGTSVSEIVSMAEAVSSCEEETIHVSVADEDHSHIVLNVDKLAKRGFCANMAFSEGLQKILKEENGNA